ncbi:MAG: AbrB/MazE/SpoVT family DNA-binding domain-containing protein [Candidatus Kerfeldbacteria bacterium]|nr:AbrB/MazE/SpoVT family DNA-binding domain-containing protein [Candidatus Kerfeldbacteria bacterium]
MAQKVLQIGSSVGVTIPKGSLRTLGLKVGDQVRLDVDENRKTVTIRPTKSESGEDGTIAKLTLRFINRYRSDLLALAKK